MPSNRQATSPADLERARLARLQMLAVLDTEPEPAFDAIVRIAASVVGTPIALISLVDDQRQWFKANHGLDGVTQTPRDVAFCAHAIRQEGVMEVPDALQDPRFSSNPLVTGDPHIRFYAGAPIQMPSGERIGTLCVIDRQPRTLSTAQQAVLKDLALVVQWALTKRAQLHQLTAIGDEARLGAISHASPLAIFQASEDGAVFYANARWDAMLGLQPDQGLGTGWQQALHPTDREAVVRAWDQAVAERADFDMEFRLQLTGGQDCHVRMQARPTTWGEPLRRGFVGVLADITRHKQIEQELRSSKSFLDRAEALSGVGGWETDLRTRTVKWTDQNCRIYDLPAGHQPGINEHLSYFGPQARLQIEATAAAALAGGPPWDIELPMTTATGRSIWVRSVGRAEFDDGKPVRLVGALQDISAQRQAQDELKAANELLTSVVDSLPCGLSVFDADLKLLVHNRQFRELQGFPDSLFKTTPVMFETFIRHNAEHGEYADAPVEATVRRIVERARTPVDHSFQRTRANGTTLEIRGAPLPHGGFVTTYVDITSARAAQEALRESEERQKRAMDASRLVLWDLDLRTEQIYLSEQWSIWQGGPEQPTITTAAALIELVPESHRTRLQEAITAVLGGGSDRYEVEHPIRCANGSVIWIHSEGRVTLRDELRRALQVTGTNQNISDRKQAEHQLARAAALNRATLESTADGIVVLGPDREVLLHNRGFLDMWGIPPHLESAGSDDLMRHVTAQIEDPEPFIARVDEELRNTPRQESLDTVRLRDGRVFEHYRRPMELDGKIVGQVWSFRDITARRRAETEIRLAKEAAEAASQAKSHFLNNVSHEIRTPLNGVLGMTRLLLAGSLTEQQRHYAELANASGQSLLGLINDLLDLGKIESGQLEFEQIEFDLNALVNELVQLYTLRAKDKDLSFTPHLPAPLPRAVRGDPTRVRQVLNNLLSNALKFTQVGQIGLGVEQAGGTPEHPVFRFTVFDSGIGIGPDAQKRLFRRFAQADASTTREFGGTGLGLAIVRELCERMGGEVTLESEPGKGSTFRCNLPFELTSAAEAIEPPAAGDQSVRPERPHHILVVEDNETNQLVVKGMLALVGFKNLTMVGNGRDAVTAAHQGDFDAILMDCQMPVMDGYEATRQLRAAKVGLPIIAMTASASAVERERCLAAGMDDFITKPIDTQTLARTLDRWIAPAVTDPSGKAGPRAAAGCADTPLVWAREQALARMDGDLELFGAIVSLFVSGARTFAARLDDAQARQSQEDLHRELHSMTGSSATVGAQVVQMRARALEELAEAGELAQVAAGIPALHHELDEFLALASRAFPAVSSD